MRGVEGKAAEGEMEGVEIEREPLPVREAWDGESKAKIPERGGVSTQDTRMTRMDQRGKSPLWVRAFHEIEKK